MGEPILDPLTDWARPVIRHLLVREGRKQYWLADRAAISAKHLNQMLQGHIAISAEMAAALLDAFGYDLVFGLTPHLAAPVSGAADGPTDQGGQRG